MEYNSRHYFGICPDDIFTRYAPRDKGAFIEQNQVVNWTLSRWKWSVFYFALISGSYVRLGRPV